LTHVTVISNPANPANKQFAQFIERVGTSPTIKITTASVTDSTQIESALSNTAQQPGGGLVVLSDAMLIVNRALIVDHAAQYRLPAVYPLRIYAWFHTA
jgi:hypothetical protein